MIAIFVVEVKMVFTCPRGGGLPVAVDVSFE